MRAPESRNRYHNALWTSLLLVLFIAPTATAWKPPPADELGPHAVGHTTDLLIDASREDRPLPLQIWYPADAADTVGAAPAQYELVAGVLYLPSDVAFEDIPVLDQNHMPLVVFSHGSGSLNVQSTALMEHLASHGFVVAAPNHTGNTIADTVPDPFAKIRLDRPQDISFVIDDMLARADDPADGFFGRISHYNIGVSGHSMGGYTALAMAAGFDTVPPDTRVKAIVPISAVTGIHTDEELAAIEVATFFLGGTEDTVVPIDPNTVRAFELVSSAYLYRADVVGANHNHFANVCQIGDFLIASGIPIAVWPAIGAGLLVPIYNETCTPEAFPIDEVQRLQNQYHVAFLTRHLKHHIGYRRELRETWNEANEPNVVFFNASVGLCGLGFEVALILPVAFWLRGRVRARRLA